ncbi:hypothetical protein QNJ95_37425 [Bradyrhizobium elkanii]|uniref:hypothetical protein n=1 Tax=Bradyrhizobium elkanii TaxID=29448 RepID=UPI002711DE96|nr:hypothetical protein [Bradyrhizobium elkanii]WLA38557.1 hypothetical protein QNJ95_37425 [Bradyrhizobium elkanii]
MTEVHDLNCEAKKPSGWKIASAIFVRVIYATFSVVIVVAVARELRDSTGRLRGVNLAKLYDQHGPAAIGIPVAGVVALMLVSLARALDGPMSLDVFGVRSEGAPAICIVWSIVFLVMGLSFRALW